MAIIARTQDGSVFGARPQTARLLIGSALIAIAGAIAGRFGPTPLAVPIELIVGVTVAGIAYGTHLRMRAMVATLCLDTARTETSDIDTRIAAMRIGLSKGARSALDDRLATKQRVASAGTTPLDITLLGGLASLVAAALLTDTAILVGALSSNLSPAAVALGVAAGATLLVSLGWRVLIAALEDDAALAITVLHTTHELSASVEDSRRRSLQRSRRARG